MILHPDSEYKPIIADRASKRAVSRKNKCGTRWLMFSHLQVFARQGTNTLVTTTRNKHCDRCHTVGNPRGTLDHPPSGMRSRLHPCPVRSTLAVPARPPAQADARGALPSASFVSGQHPAARRKQRTSSDPFLAARCRAVSPPRFSAASTRFAPALACKFQVADKHQRGGTCEYLHQDMKEPMF